MGKGESVTAWTWLRNSWMNDATYLAAMAHIAWACLIVLAADVLSRDARAWERGVTLTLVLFAALKEYVYDAHFEEPPQTWRDNTQDFVGYCCGIALAWGIIGASSWLR
jgi:hypothetical protein